MRRFIGDQAFEPVQARFGPRSAGDASAPAPYVPPRPGEVGWGWKAFIGLFALAMLAFSVERWRADDRTPAVAVGAMALLVLFMVFGTRKQDFRSDYKQGAGGLVIFLSAWLILVVGTVFTWRDAPGLGAIALTVFSLFWSVGMVSMVSQRVQSRRVAARMAAAGDARAAPPAAAPAPKVRAGQPPPLELQVWLQSELPPLAHAYRAPVAADSNVLGQPPRDLLYLYNFYSPEGLSRKLENNWRRFGPVWFLGSPGDVAYAHAFAADIAQAVARLLLPDPAAFDAAYASLQRAPLPPGDRQLTGISRLSGGYAQTMFLCGDASWRHAADRLFADAAHVLLDASDYDPERAGLNWEIGQVVDRVDTARLLVLVDGDADQAALCAAFRAAWADMAADSPNNRPDAAPLRWVRMADYDVKGHQAAPAPPPGPEFDPEGRFGEMNFVLRRLMQVHLERALEEDRVYAFLTGSTPAGDDGGQGA